MNSPTIRLTRREARRFLLSYQGLLQPERWQDRTGIMDFFRRVGSIQFDPLNIVGRNPELVLHARVDRFAPTDLHHLLYRERRLLDGWDKMMSIYPIEDWPHFAHHRLETKKKMEKSRRAKPALRAAHRVREEIRSRGPLSSSDIELTDTVDWSWAPTRLSRAVLESLYHTGELIVHHKVGVRKYYDFAARHLPPEQHAPFHSLDDYHDWRIERRIGSVGLLWDRSGGRTGIRLLRIAYSAR